MQKILNIGSGSKKIKGAVNLDIAKGKNVDIVHNLNKKPYPFKDNTFDKVTGEHVAEHVEDTISMIEELYRITKPGGIIRLVVPHHASGNACGNVTHVKFFNHMAFVNLSYEANLKDSDELLKSAKYKLKIKELKITMGRLKFLEGFVNRFMKLYDYYLCYIIRPMNIVVEYEVLKP